MAMLVGYAATLRPRWDCHVFHCDPACSLIAPTRSVAAKKMQVQSSDSYCDTYRMSSSYPDCLLPVCANVSFHLIASKYVVPSTTAGLSTLVLFKRYHTCPQSLQPWIFTHLISCICIAISVCLCNAHGWYGKTAPARGSYALIVSTPPSISHPCSITPSFHIFTPKVLTGPYKDPLQI